MRPNSKFTGSQNLFPMGPRNRLGKGQEWRAPSLLLMASVTGCPRGQRGPALITSPVWLSQQCPMCLLDSYQGSPHTPHSRTGHPFIQDFVGLCGQLIHRCINKTQVWPSSDELHCLNELNSCIRERKQGESIRENFFHQRVSISRGLEVSVEMST